MSVKIYKTIRLTPGGFHSWVDSEVGIIRKPNHMLYDVREPVAAIKPAAELIAQPIVRHPWWLRLWAWLTKKLGL